MIQKSLVGLRLQGNFSVAFTVGFRRSEGENMLLRGLEFLAIVLTAIILVPSGAHFFELPNKIGLVQEQYFIVQNIYRGWALFGGAIFPALIAIALLAWTARSHVFEFRLAVLAFFCIALSLAVFFTFVYPGNVATENWTTVPENWISLRRHWEYGHAASAILTFVALCALVLGVVARR
jgi:hypothetical protein